MDNKSLDALFTGLTVTGNPPKETENKPIPVKGKKGKSLSARAKQRQLEKERAHLKKCVD